MFDDIHLYSRHAIGRLTLFTMDGVLPENQITGYNKYFCTTHVKIENITYYVTGDRDTTIKYYVILHYPTARHNEIIEFSSNRSCTTVDRGMFVEAGLRRNFGRTD